MVKLQFIIICITYSKSKFIQRFNYNKITDINITDLLSRKNNFCSECLFIIFTVSNLENIQKNNIFKFQINPTIEGGEVGWQIRLCKRLFFQKKSPHNISQIETNIKHPFRKDIKKNIIPKTQPNPIVDGRDTTTKIFNH